MTVKLTRRVVFSSGHRYWKNSLSADENYALFGNIASPYSHGHNYELYVTVKGKMKEENGMVINIKRLDEILQVRVVKMLDSKSINDEIPIFIDRAPTVENLLLCFWEQIAGTPAPLARRLPLSWRWDSDATHTWPEHHMRLPDGVELFELQLKENELLSGALTRTDPRTCTMTLTRTYEFSAAHRLHADQLTDKENIDLFGKCNGISGHGHNYLLEVTVEGEPSSDTGMLVNLDELDRRVNNRVIERYDHMNLNVDVPELEGKIPTSEVVAVEIFKKLEGQLPVKLKKIRLHETARSSFEVSAS